MKEETKLLTLAFAKDKDKILLAMKKRGFGKGKWNGYGGKVQGLETIEEAAIREINEESEIKVKELEKKGIIQFDLPKEDKLLEVHVFEIKKYEGKSKETEEMKPQWFKHEDVPYEEMWPDDKYWLPLFIDNKKIKANFTFDEEDRVVDYTIEETEDL